jgi:hypothetical protein
VSGKPAAISVTRSQAPATCWFKQAQRIDEGAGFAAQRYDAQADLVADQHTGPGADSIARA